MIDSKEDLKAYLEADRFAMGRAGRRPRFYDHAWRYLILLRRLEYSLNCRRGWWGKLCTAWYTLRLHQMGIKCCGYTIPPNVCGRGLSLAHLGPIIISGGARLGEYCRLHVGVNIGTAAGQSAAAPHLGDRIYLAPGAKLFGSITLASDIAVGANAVVNKSCTTPGVTLAGVPARVISQKGSHGLLLAPPRAHSTKTP